MEDEIRQEFPDLRRHLLAGQAPVVGIVFRWVGRRRPISVIRQYIEQQSRPAGPCFRPTTFTTGLKVGALAATW